MLCKISNNSHHFTLSILALCVAIFLSCNISSTSDPLTTSNDTYDPIEGKVFFHFREMFESSDEKEQPRITLILRTEKLYSHGGLEIASEMALEKNTINIKINGIKHQNVGTDAFTYARWKTFLDIPNGNYELTFSRNWNHPKRTACLDTCIVLVDEKSIRVKKTTQNFTDTDYDLYWRYPQNSFAYICGTLVQDSCMCTVFLDSLKKIIDIEQFIFPNEGIKPYPLYSSGHYYDTPAQYFKYFDEQDYLKAGEFLKNYSKEVLKDYEGLSISLIGWNNVNYMSWVQD